jgi:lipopolysaccharide export system protein LptC
METNGSVMREAADGAIDGGGIGGDDLRHAVPGRRVRPAPLPSAARRAADRHSRRVRRLKILVPALAVIVVLGIVGVAWVQSRLQGALDVKNVLFSKDGLTMVEPHLSGHAQGRAYDVSAQREIGRASCRERVS